MDGRCIWVIKRDGSVEPFVFAKLLKCIGDGFNASGESQERIGPTSRSLVEAVHAFLKSSDPKTPVSAEHLAELVELVLTQTGHVAASMAIQQHAQWRDQQRNWLRVAQQRDAGGRYVHHRWKKSHVIQHLQKKHLLRGPTARMMAGRVEQLIFNCGLKVVTTGMVREVVKSELLAWGLLPSVFAVAKRKADRDTRKIENKTEMG